MSIAIPKLKDNLKNLKAVRRAIVIDADATARQQTNVSIILEAKIAANIDEVLGYLSINRTPDSSSDPVLLVSARILDIPHDQLNMHFVGTSLVLLEDVLLARTFNWVPPVISTSPPKNATTEIWSAPDAASVAPNGAVAGQLEADVNRLVGAFAEDWKQANG